MAEKDLVNQLLNFGVAVIVMLWFMFRAEGKLDKLAKEMVDLGGKVVALALQIAEARSDVKEVDKEVREITGVHKTEALARKGSTP